MRNFIKKYDKRIVYSVIISVTLILLILAVVLIPNTLSNSNNVDVEKSDVPFEEMSIIMNDSGDAFIEQEDGTYITSGVDTGYGAASSLYDVVIDEYAFKGRSNVIEYLCNTYNMVDKTENTVNTTGHTYEVVCGTPTDDMDTKELIYGVDQNGYTLKYTEKFTSNNMSTVAYSIVVNNITDITGYNINNINKDVNKIIGTKGTVQKTAVNQLNGDTITVYVNNTGDYNWEVSIEIRSNASVQEVETTENNVDAE